MDYAKIIRGLWKNIPKKKMIPVISQITILGLKINPQTQSSIKSLKYSNGYSA